MLKEYEKKPCDGKVKDCEKCDYHDVLGGRDLCGFPSEPSARYRTFEIGRRSFKAAEFLNLLLNTPEYMIPKEFAHAKWKAQEMYRDELDRHEEAVARIGIEILKDLPEVKETTKR
jgi:hypothetical protein